LHYRCILALEKRTVAENVINISSGKLSLADDGIINQTVFPDTHFTLKDARDAIAAALKLSKGNPCLILVNLTGMRSITREAREYFGEVTSQKFSAVGLLFKSPVTKVLGNFFLRFNKPKTPVRLFSSEAEALKWLKGFSK
jgi:hypothetical protein